MVILYNIHTMGYVITITCAYYTGVTWREHFDYYASNGVTCRFENPTLMHVLNPLLIHCFLSNLLSSYVG